MDAVSIRCNVNDNRQKCTYEINADDTIQLIYSIEFQVPENCKTF